MPTAYARLVAGLAGEVAELAAAGAHIEQAQAQGDTGARHEGKAGERGSPGPVDMLEPRCVGGLVVLTVMMRVVVRQLLRFGNALLLDQATASTENDAQHFAGLGIFGLPAIPAGLLAQAATERHRLLHGGRVHVGCRSPQTMVRKPAGTTRKFQPSDRTITAKFPTSTAGSQAVDASLR
jgi:hypothetical protein